MRVNGWKRVMIAVAAAALVAAPVAGSESLGFVVVEHDGHPWIFESDVTPSFSDKHVTRVVSGPTGVKTLKAPDRDTLAGYLAARPGFVTRARGEHLWIFLPGSEALDAFGRGAPPADHLTRVSREGDAIVTLKAPSSATLAAWTAPRKDGFVSRVRDDGWWIFTVDSPDLATFDAGGAMGPHERRLAGPEAPHPILKAPDAATLDAWSAARPGFAATVRDGVTWVFRESDPTLAAFLDGAEPAKNVTRLATTDGGVRVLRAPDRETLDEHAAWKPGFVTRTREGRLWVFAEGSPALTDFDAGREPAKHVTRVLAQGDEVTVFKSPDGEVLSRYLANG